MENELKFIGAIVKGGSKQWIDDERLLSRNFKQGARVYSAEGIAATLTAKGVGGIGGMTGLYLVKSKGKMDGVVNENKSTQI